MTTAGIHRTRHRTRSRPGEACASALIVRTASGIARAIGEELDSVSLVERGEAAVPDTFLGVLLTDLLPPPIGVSRAPSTAIVRASVGAPHGASVGAIFEPPQVEPSRAVGLRPVRSFPRVSRRSPTRHGCVVVRRRADDRDNHGDAASPGPPRVGQPGGKGDGASSIVHSRPLLRTHVRNARSTRRTGSRRPIREPFQPRSPR